MEDDKSEIEDSNFDTSTEMALVEEDGPDETSPSTSGEGELGLIEVSSFGESSGKLQLTPAQAHAVEFTWTSLLKSLANDREIIGDAIYGAAYQVAGPMKVHFKTPRAAIILKFFNGLKAIVESCGKPSELKTFVDNLAFRHLGIELTYQRVDALIDSLLEFFHQQTSHLELPPETDEAWRILLLYVGSVIRYVSNTYGERLDMINEDWQSIKSAEQAAAQEDKDAQLRTFSNLCQFNHTVMGKDGKDADGWMTDLFTAFDSLVEAGGNPSKLAEETDVMAIKLLHKNNKEIPLAKFKPVMLSALRSLLPQTWSTEHEAAWGWLWSTIAGNLQEALMKVRAFKPFAERFHKNLTSELHEQFRYRLYSVLFSKCPESQDIFKQSSTRLRYIADRVLIFSHDAYFMPTVKLVNELSALGLRHVGYAVPVELFSPFVDVAVEVMRPIVDSVPNPTTSEKQILCPADKAHYLAESEVAAHLMLEGFRWSVGLVARILCRTIGEGSTATMQAINSDDERRLFRALIDAPRSQRVEYQLRVRVGTQSISPLCWALESGNNAAAKSIIQDVLTIRADRERYYYGADQLFSYQPDVAARICRLAPLLARDLLDGLIWRSHTTQDGLRAVIYYVKYLLKDVDESYMPARALRTLIELQDPKLIRHPMLVFTTNLLWQNLATTVFLQERLWTLLCGVLFVLSQCVLNRIDSELAVAAVAGIRCLIYVAALGRLVFSHCKEIIFALGQKDVVYFRCVPVPRYLTVGIRQVSAALAINLFLLACAEPVFFCMGHDATLALDCRSHSEGLMMAYQILSSIGVALYFVLILDLASISVQLSAYRVIITRSVGQLVMCLLAIAFLIASFTFTLSALSVELEKVDLVEFQSSDQIAMVLFRIALMLYDLDSVLQLASQSFLLFSLLAVYALLVYIFILNLLVAQLCCVQVALSEDLQGHARLAHGKILLDVFKGVSRARWQHFLALLDLDSCVDFGEGDKGLPGGVKDWEAALLHPVDKEQIARYGGHALPELPWPEKEVEEVDMETRMQKMIQKTIQGALRKHNDTLGQSGTSIGPSSVNDSL
ncbi:unnamed protein product [Effrenium voratum]|nr:unnamed protein product [Effrenium voratum]